MTSIKVSSSSSSSLPTGGIVVLSKNYYRIVIFIIIVIVLGNIYWLIQSIILNTTSNCYPFMNGIRTKTTIEVNTNNNKGDADGASNNINDVIIDINTDDGDRNDSNDYSSTDNADNNNNNNDDYDYKNGYTDNEIALLLSLYDWNTIEYMSGIMDLDATYDTMVYNQCNNQSGYEVEAGPFHDYCADPIVHPLRCCFCYYNTFPSFIYEELYTTTTTSIYNNNNKYQQHWKKQLSLLHLPRNQSKLAVLLDTNITDNSYKYVHDPDRISYYFCMAPRKYSLPVHYMNSTLLRTKNILSKEQQLVLVTGKYGYNNRFKDEMINSCTDIEKQHLFDTVHCNYDDEIFLQNDETLKIKFARHRQYLVNETDASARGGGYWFHKVVQVRYYMNVYRDNDYIFYSDQDYIDRIEPLGLYKMVQVMQQRNADIILELLGGIEKDWTKEDMLNAFNATDAIRNSYQVWGGIMLVRNNALMRKFFDALIDCNANYHMISDEPSIVPNYDGYQENRHDQSILSLFYKTFLSNQTVIGPPVQPYFELNRYTFQLYNTTKVYCPF